MRIEVKNNSAVKAYRVMMKKLNKDYGGNYFKFLRDLEFYVPKSERLTLKHKKALAHQKKLDDARKRAFEREETRQIIDSKRRAKEFKKKQGHKKH